MKKFFSVLSIMLISFMVVSCSLLSDDFRTANCYNGKFVGLYETETGVLSFKGIPYAKAPVGNRRWKAPEAVDASDELIYAYDFGNSAIQYSWFSENITTDVSEDCLTLNVWTKDLRTKNKPVMVYFHGGSFAWGGTSESLYSGQYIVNEHEDVIVVTCNYRIGMMGFIDLSGVPGGEDYTDSTQLGLLDAIESLRWIKNNIESFGGDPNNVTIFGESAGGGIVSSLLASEYAGELFQRVIAQSGTFSQSRDPEKTYSNNQAEILMELSGAKNMEDLIALTEEELIEFNELELDEYGTCLNDMYSLPTRGGILPLDPYKAIENAKAKGVDLMIGTNTEESNYWICETVGIELMYLSEEQLEYAISLFEEEFVDVTFEKMMNNLTDDEKEDIYAYMNLHSDLDEVWQKSMVLNEYMFRASSIRMAECYSEAEGTGKTYMYLFGKQNYDINCLGSCHSSELSYVFHNLEYSDISGEIDEALADKVCSAWVNFAKTGNPSTSDVIWEEYDVTNRYTMVIGNDCTLSVVSDPMSEERKLTSCLAHIYLSGGNGF